MDPNKKKLYLAIIAAFMVIGTALTAYVTTLDEAAVVIKPAPNDPPVVLPTDPPVLPPGPGDIPIPPVPPATAGYDLTASSLLLEGFNGQLDANGEPEAGKLASLGFPFAYMPPIAGFERYNACYRWSGALLPLEDGEHTFTGNVKSAGYVILDGDVVWSEDRELDPTNHNSFKFEFKRTLTKGKLCPIKAALFVQGAEHIFELKWTRPGKTVAESISSLMCRPPADWQSRLKTFVPPVVVPGPSPVSDLIIPPLITADYQSPDLPADFMQAKCFEPWLRDVSTAPVDAKSVAYITSLGTFRAQADCGPGFGIPFQVVAADTPPVVVTVLDVPHESDAGPWKIPMPPVVEGGGDPSKGDVHWNGYTHGVLEEVYQLRQRKSDGKWYAYQGTRWDLNKPWDQRPLRWTSADAAGLPIVPGLIRYQEIASGEINHAIRCTIGRSQRAFVAPARHFASTNTDQNFLPMGAVLRLKASVDISNLKPQAKIVATAMKKHGLIVADNGSSGIVFVTGAPDKRLDVEDLAGLKTLKQDAFEVVETGPITRN